MKVVINNIEDLKQNIEMLNNTLDKKLINRSTLLDMASIEKFKEVEKEINILLNSISSQVLAETDRDTVDIILAHLHFKISWLSRRIDQMRGLIEMVLGEYRKTIYKQRDAK